ncbi:MOSC domain-containing protein [Azonexus sp. IMCC34839]|uniref:MOSC domain-containing protein n=1 Tax=Azonexus sp. IMCC34839 TaxID=3133695 RepID=UPI00399B78EE
MTAMVVEHLFLSPQRGAPQQACAQLELRAGQGVVGDRHQGRTDWSGQNLTLVEAEEIEAFCALSQREVDWSLTRRNVVTRGLRLNDLVGKTFRLGDCLLRGVERCEPCRTLGQRLENTVLTGPQVVSHWLGRGGLRVDVLRGGTLRIGDIPEIVEGGA